MMCATDSERKFRVSREGQRLISQQAARENQSVAAIFRRKASKLVRAARPQFNPPGHSLDRELVVGLAPEVHAALVDVVYRLHVPRSTIGELVVSFIEEDAYAEA
jgi:hypothetical protein